MLPPGYPWVPSANISPFGPVVWPAIGNIYSIYICSCLSIYLSIRSLVYLSIYLSIYLITWLFVYLSIYLLDHLSICLSIYLSILLLDYLSTIYLSIYYFITWLFVYLSIYLSIRLLVYLSICQCLMKTNIGIWGVEGPSVWWDICQTLSYLHLDQGQLVRSRSRLELGVG